METQGSACRSDCCTAGPIVGSVADVDFFHRKYLSCWIKVNRLGGLVVYYLCVDFLINEWVIVVTSVARVWIPSVYTEAVRRRDTARLGIKAPKITVVREEE